MPGKKQPAKLPEAIAEKNKGKPQKKAAAAKDAKPKRVSFKKNNPLFIARPKNFGIGQDIRRGRDLTHFVKWPLYVRIQRQKRVLMHRLKVPPSINQFNFTLDKAGATSLLALLNKYRPESAAEKKERRLAQAKERDSKGAVKVKGRKEVVHGLAEVTSAVERGRAKLVAIAHDVEPIELVLWLPALCRKMGVPYCIVKNKSRLGTVVHRRTVTCLALTSVNKEDDNALKALQTKCLKSFNENPEPRRTWGGLRLGRKSVAQIKKREKALAKLKKK